MSYKRNQIEEAIARIIDPSSQKPPSELRTRIKRLLELDRSIGRKVRSKDPEEANFAFFSEEAPGTGADILFSEYEAFALLNGLRIMNHGWPQSVTVSIMRRVRVDLEREHARILQQDPDKLFGGKSIRARARPGDIAVDNTDPVFLTVASKGRPFKPGNPGRPPGSKNKTTRMAEQLVEGQAEQLVQKVLELAQAGNVAALRMVLDRVWPPRKGQPVNVVMPPINTSEDVLPAIVSIWAAIRQGGLTPEEASALSIVMDRSIQAIELHDITKRIAALEARDKRNETR